MNVEKVVCDRVYLSREILPKIIVNKKSFTILREYSTMFSYAYIEVIEKMFNRKGILRYFSSPIDDILIFNYVLDQLKGIAGLGPLIV
ncbi:hypothetical protein PMAYCL1PPCAC_25703, partial [Pristionchus mayeri]